MIGVRFPFNEKSGAIIISRSSSLDIFIIQERFLSKSFLV
jgi:hypothetical protein